MDSQGRRAGGLRRSRAPIRARGHSEEGSLRYRNVPDGARTIRWKGRMLCREVQRGSCNGIDRSDRRVKGSIAAHQYNECLSSENRVLARVVRPPELRDTGVAGTSRCGSGHPPLQHRLTAQGGHGDGELPAQARVHAQGMALPCSHSFPSSWGLRRPCQVGSSREALAHSIDQATREPDGFLRFGGHSRRALVRSTSSRGIEHFERGYPKYAPRRLVFCHRLGRQEGQTGRRPLRAPLLYRR